MSLVRQNYPTRRNISDSYFRSVRWQFPPRSREFLASTSGGIRTSSAQSGDSQQRWAKIILCNRRRKEQTLFKQRHVGFAKNGIIVKTPIPPAVNENNVRSDRDRLTGLPLDDKGRYTQNIAVDGTTYAPKYFPCATPECLGNNLDMSDPVQAMDKKVFDDINRTAALAALASPLGPIGGTAGVVGISSSIASGIISDQGVQAAFNESGQIGAQRYLEQVWKIPAASAVRIITVIDLAGGWDAFTQRVNQELMSEKK